MKRVALVLSLVAVSPVGSALAGTLDDSLYINGVLQTPAGTISGGGGIPELGLFFPEATPPNPSGGVVLTEGTGGTFVSDILSYTGRGFILESDTGTSLGTGGTTGYLFLKETGGIQNVGAAFGLAPNAIQIQSVAPTPLPAAWTLMVVGLVGLGFMLHRRGRTQAASGMAIA